MSRLILRLLGPPLVELDGEPVHIARHKALALLAYLAVTAQPHSRDALAALLWPDLDQSNARAEVRRALSLLRRTLGDGWLEVDRETAAWEPQGEAWLDVAAFRQALAGCAAHGHGAEEACADCVPLLVEAVELYCDGFLAGFTLPDSPAFDEWQFFEGEGLRDGAASALKRLARWHGGRGEHEAAIGHARRWVALDPLHEPAQRELMALYARAGQRAAALRQYAECERLLREELGAEPDEETRALHAWIQKDLSGVGQEPSDRMPRRSGGSLPVWLSPFVGRQEELARIAQYLADPACRLLTLIGPGGSGKTRLAVEAADREVSRYAHGVFFVSLAPLQSVESVVAAVSQAIGFSFSSGEEPRQQLHSYLRQKRILLLLDGFEHLLVLPGAERNDQTDLVTDILRTAPAVRILVTSRAALNVEGEQLLPVPGMSYPALIPGSALESRQELQDSKPYSAVQLFLQGARRVRPGFEPTAEELAQVVEICRQVEGMPMALLLAAAWMRLLSPAEIAVQVAGHSMDFLEVDWHDVPRRQRSIRATFDHSWHLLSEHEQEVFAALAVFRGGMTFEAAQQVAETTLPELAGLVDTSLLHYAQDRPSAPGAKGRYDVHELLRRYGEKRLGGSMDGGQGIRDRHAAYYSAALERWVVELKGPRQRAAWAEMEAESGNARAACEWMIERGNVEHLDRAMDGYGELLYRQGRWEEGEGIFAAAAQRLTPPEPGGPLSPARARVLARAWAWQASLGRAWQGPLPVLRTVLEQSLTLLEHLSAAGHEVRRERAFALKELGLFSQFTGDVEGFARPVRESLALYEALGDRTGMAETLDLLGAQAWDAGNIEEAKHLREQARSLSTG